MSELQIDFDWTALRTATDGRSYVDVPRLNVGNKPEAKRFLHAYGYDVDDPMVREEIWKVHFEAVSFLRNALLDPGESVPPEFLARSEKSDILRLLTEASKPEPDATGRWACAILRVMHIISHLDNDVRQENFQYAREQIFERFDKMAQKEEGGRGVIFGEGGQGIRLVRYLKKERKDRNSILVKLLSKPKAVVEAIYDRIGFRLVTETKLEAFRLVQFLLDKGVVSPPNIHPSRSFNTLIPTDLLEEELKLLSARFKEKEIDAAQLRYELQKLETETGVSLAASRNRFTSSWYRAIQFTCRQLIVAPDPTYRFWQQMKPELEKTPGMAEALKRIPVTLRERRTFYCPFEIQILDKESYVEAIGGRSRHREYKSKQRLMARNRVLRDLV